MAGKYDNFYKMVNGGSPNENKSQLSSNQKSINNLKTRLAAGGVNPEEALDKRNWFEKLTNLPQDQNVIFDLLELINRPQQALFKGITNYQTGEGTFGEGLKEGISGKSDTGFKEILKNMAGSELGDVTYNDLIQQGEDPGFKTLLKSIDLVDVAGLVGDVALDPMDLPIIPVVSKAGKAVDTAGDIAKTVDKVGDVAKTVDKVNDISKTVDFISPTQAIGKAGKAAIKGTAKGTDRLIEKGLGAIDNARGINYARKDAKWASELGKLGEGNGILEAYKGLKNNLSTMFSTKLAKNAQGIARINDVKEVMTSRYLQEEYGTVKKVIDAAAERTGKSVDELQKLAFNAVDIVDEIPMSSVITDAANGTIKYSKNIEKRLVDIAKDVPDVSDNLISGIKKTKDGLLELSDDWLKNLDKFAPEKLDGVDAMVKRSSFLSKEAQMAKKADMKWLNENAPEVVDAVKNFYKKGNESIEKQFKTMKGFSNKYLDSNNTGWTKHVLDADYNKNLNKLATDFGADPEAIRQLSPNVQGSGLGGNTLNSRFYNMPVDEANMLKKKELLKLPGLSDAGKQFVKDNVNLFDTSGVYKSMETYMSDVPKYAKNLENINEVFLKQGFGDLDELNKLNKQLATGLDEAGNAIDKTKVTEQLNKVLDNSPFRIVEGNKTPYGFKKLDTDTKSKIVNFLKSSSGKVGNKELTDLANKIDKLDNVAIDPTVLQILKMNSNQTQISELAKMHNSLMRYFKGNATATATNQLNNINGNISNMYLSGMPVNELAKKIPQAFDDLYVQKYDDILRKAATDIDSLTPNEKRIFETLSLFEQNVGLTTSEAILEKYGLDDLVSEWGKGKTKNPYKKYVNAMAQLNGAEDRMFKYALYEYALDNPQYIRNLGIDLAANASKEEIAKAAGDAVRKVLFDPKNLTAFENNTVKKIIPFYNFAKNNILYHVSNMGDNLQQYNKLMKAQKSITRQLYSDEDYENMADYLKTNMYIPIFGKDKNGNYAFLRSNLALGDFVDFVDDPFNSIATKLSPVIKTPIELYTNKNMFNNLDIEKFPGEYGDIKALQGIPVLGTKKGQHAISNITGLSQPFNQFSRLYEGYKDDGVGGALTNMITNTKNVDTDKLTRSYQQIDELQNLMKQYQQKGYQFSTMQELKKANKNGTISGLDALFAKYGIETTSNKNKSKYQELYDMLQQQ